MRNIKAKPAYRKGAGQRYVHGVVGSGGSKVLLLFNGAVIVDGHNAVGFAGSKTGNIDGAVSAVINTILVFC